MDADSNHIMWMRILLITAPAFLPLDKVIPPMEVCKAVERRGSKQQVCSSHENKQTISSSTNTFAKSSIASTCLLSFTHAPQVIYSNASKYRIGSSSTLFDYHLV
jgi:hypothetical protein